MHAESLYRVDDGELFYFSTLKQYSAESNNDLGMWQDHCLTELVAELDDKLLAHGMDAYQFVTNKNIPFLEENNNLNKLGILCT